MLYYLGPWEWKRDDAGWYWSPPDGAVATLDLRPLASCEAGPTQPHNIGVFAVDKPLADARYTSLGDNLDSNLKPEQLTAWRDATGADRLTAKTLRDVLWETVTTQADALGERRAKPLRPDIQGMFRLYLGELVKAEPWGGPTDERWPVLRESIRADFRATHERDAALARKLLTDWEDLYGLDWHEYVPDDLQSAVIGPLPKSTTITDDFTDPNGTSLDAHTGDQGFSWTEVAANWTINSNAVAGSTLGSARAESDLSSSDMYSQVKVVTRGSVPCGAAARFASGAETFYTAASSQYNGYLFKVVAGARTELWRGAGSVQNGDTVKCDIQGSTLKHYVNGVEKHSLSDSSISSGTRAGLFVFSSVLVLDNFEAADYGGDGSGSASIGSASGGSASPGSESAGSASVGSASAGSASVGSASAGSGSVGSGSVGSGSVGSGSAGSGSGSAGSGSAGSGSEGSGSGSAGSGSAGSVGSGSAGSGSAGSGSAGSGSGSAGSGSAGSAGSGSAGSGSAGSGSAGSGSAGSGSAGSGSAGSGSGASAAAEFLCLTGATGTGLTNTGATSTGLSDTGATSAGHTLTGSTLTCG